MGLKHCYDVFDAELLCRAKFAGKYEFPMIGENHFRPSRAVPFDRLKKMNKEKNLWVHFYVHDYRFLPVLRAPEKYISILRNYEGMIGMDNSIYRDLPLGEQIHSVYLNRVFDYYLFSKGLPVIPNISWGDYRSFSFCFDGIQKGTTVAVSSYGCVRQKVDQEYFLDGFNEMLNRIQPDAVIFHGALNDAVKKMTEQHETLLVPLKSHLQEIFSKGVA